MMVSRRVRRARRRCYRRAVEDAGATLPAEILPLRPGVRAFIRPALLAVLVLGGVLALRWLPGGDGWLRADRATVDRLAREAVSHPIAGVLLLFAISIAAPLVWIPRIAVHAVGGCLFGPLTGGGVSALGCSLGGFACWGLARRLGREAVRRRLGGRFGRLGVAVGRNGALFVLAVRLFPVGNFTATSYILGISPVKPLAFLAGGFLGILPTALLYALLGDAILDGTLAKSAVTAAGFAVFSVAGFLLFRRLLRDAQPPPPREISSAS